MKKNYLGGIWYKALGVGLVLYALIYGLLTQLPVMRTLEQSSRNLFYHVPMWFTEVVLMSMSVFFSLRYLRMTDPESNAKGDALSLDVRAKEAAQLGVLFNILG